MMLIRQYLCTLLFLSATLVQSQSPYGLSDNSSRTVKTWAPLFDFDTDSCYPAPAMFLDRSLNAGLDPNKESSSKGCREQSQFDNANVYSRIRTINHNGDQYQFIMYSLYFPKDWYSNAIVNSVFEYNHRHDLEWVGVWLKNGKLTHASYSAHGSDGETKKKSELFFDKGREKNIKVVYHKHNIRTHTMRFAQEGEEAENFTGKWYTPRLLEWDFMCSKDKDILVSHDFGSATLPIKESEFYKNIENYLPEVKGYPSANIWRQGTGNSIDRPITDLYIVAHDEGEERTTPKGYEKISYDLNKNAKGDDIYLCYTRDLSKGNPITDIRIETFNDEPSGNDINSDGFQSIRNSEGKKNYDLNNDAGGKYIYATFKRNNGSKPITSLQIIGGSDKEEIKAEANWTKLSNDLNEDAEGDFIYVVYKKENQVQPFWKKMPSTASSITAGAASRVFKRNSDNEIYSWSEENSNWARVGRKSVSMAVSSNGNLLIVAENGEIWKYSESKWSKMPGKAKEISAGDGNKIYITNFDNSELQQWNEKNSKWVRVGRNAESMTVASDGRLWTVTSDGNIWRQSGTKWSQIEGTASAIAAGPCNRVFTTNPQNAELYEWKENKQSWDRVGRKALSMELDSKGNLWIVNEKNEIWRYNYNL